MGPDLVSSASGWLLTYLVHSSVLLGITWLVTRWWVASPHFRDTLWKAALLGGFVTATLQGWADLEPLAGRMTLSRASAEPHTPATAGEQQWGGLLHQAAPLAPVAAAPVGDNPTVDATLAPTESRESIAAWRPPRAEAALLALWALSALVMAGLFLVQRARAIRGLGRRCEVTDPGLLGTLADLRRQAGFGRPVRLTVASGLSSPVALGSAEIVLPPAALAELGALEQRSLLAHELAHLARRDPHWLAFGCLVERIFFLQPLNRIARVRLQEAAEYLCDDWAVRRVGSGDSLATCLVKVAGWVGTVSRPIPLAGMAERPSQLATRVHRLIERQTMPTRSRTFWLFASAFALVGSTAIAAPAVTASPFTVAPSDVAVSEAQDTGAAALSRTLRQAQLAAARAQADARRAMSADVRRAMSQARAELAGVQVAPRAPVAPMAPLTVTMPAIAPLALRMDHVRAELDALGGRSARDTTSPAVPPLMVALKDSDVEVRRAAAQSLANLEDVRAVPAFIEATRDGDAEVRATAAMGLGQLEDARGQPALIALLKDADKHVRYSALSALHSMPGPVPTDVVVGALNDPDADIRQAAIGLAYSQLSDREEGTPADPRYVAAFTKLLADPSPDVRTQAASALGETGLTLAPASLLAAAKDKNADVRQQVASALGRIGDPKSVLTLKEMLQDSDADVREQAVMALGEIRDRSALEALVAALKSTDPTVRRNAAMALGQRGEE